MTKKGVNKIINLILEIDNILNAIFRTRPFSMHCGRNTFWLAQKYSGYFYYLIASYSLLTI